jgi:hypothetical protein
MKKLLVVLALFSLFCIPALAETPAGEVYGGYQLFHHPGDDGSDGVNYHGFLASGEYNITSYLGAVGEFGYVQHTFEGDSEAEKFTTFLFGPRVSYRMDKARLFAHFLLGVGRFSFAGESASNYTHAIGGGVDIALNDTISIRPAQLDLVQIRWTEDFDGESFSEWFNHLRYSGGVVIKFGSK